MGLFRHPHLVRGIVHTSEGAFHIERGIADVPDEVGSALGWTRVEDEPPQMIQQVRTGSKPADAPARHAGAL
jgi:hypothetical protein